MKMQFPKISSIAHISQLQQKQIRVSTICMILLILLSSLPFGDSFYCLVLHIVAGKLNCTTADFFHLAAILAVPCLVVNTCVDISTSNLSDYNCKFPSTSSA